MAAALGAVSLVVSAPVVQLAGAQGPRGAGPDARTPAAGTLRVGFAANWTRSSETYENGVLLPIGSRFTMASVGPETIRSLQPIEGAARLAAGLPDFGASLGAIQTGARSRFESTPLSMEYGVTSRLAIGAVVPFVTSISRVDVAVNASTGTATVGWNPALTSESIVAANQQLLSQFDAASAFLSQRIASCLASPGGAGCGAIVAAPAAAQSLVAESQSFANAIAALYGGRNGSAGAPFIPLAGSPAQAAIAARLAGFKAQYAVFGTTQLTGAAPIGAPASMTGVQFQQLLSDSLHGIMANPLVPVVRRGTGDIDLSAAYTWHDSYAPVRPGARWRDNLWWRSALVGVYRLGSGAPAEAADLIPVAVGDHQNDIEVRSISDVGVGRFSLTSSLRYTVQAGTDVSVRVPPTPRDPFPESFRTIAARHVPGNELAIELFPRWTPSEAMSVAAFYGYRSRGEDSWSGTDIATGPTGSQVALNLSVLGRNSAEREHRFGASVAYSSLGAWERGQARWPIEIAISHYQTTSGSGGIVPKLVHDDVQIRWYFRLLGRDEPRR